MEIDRKGGRKGTKRGDKDIKRGGKIQKERKNSEKEEAYTLYIQYIIHTYIYYTQSFRHQICDFSIDIILYDFVHSNIGSSFDSKKYS